LRVGVNILNFRPGANPEALLRWGRMNLPIKLWVDADALPNEIKDIILRASRRASVETVFVANRTSGSRMIPWPPSSA
jgi:hypothetical protein